MNFHRIVLAALLAAAGSQVAGSQTAMAQDIDMATIKCSEFVSAKPADIGNILIWLEGFYTKENAAPVLHQAKMEADGKHLGEYCKAHPTDGLITAAEAVMPVKEDK